LGVLPPGGRHNPVKAGVGMQTGYPVMVVVVVVIIAEVTVQAATDPLKRIAVWLIFKSAAFIMRIEIMK
jgi:hypothetical protein